MSNNKKETGETIDILATGTLPNHRSIHVYRIGLLLMLHSGTHRNHETNQQI